MLYRGEKRMVAERSFGFREQGRFRWYSASHYVPRCGAQVWQFENPLFRGTFELQFSNHVGLCSEATIFAFEAPFADICTLQKLILLPLMIFAHAFTREFKKTSSGTPQPTDSRVSL